MTSRSSRPSPALVIALLALVVSLSGTAYAAVQLPKSSVGAKQLKKNAVTVKKIKNGAVTLDKLAVTARPQLPQTLEDADSKRILLTAAYQEIVGVTVPAGKWLVQAKAVSVVNATGVVSCDLMIGPGVVGDHALPFYNDVPGPEVHGGFSLLSVATLTQPTKVFMQCRSETAEAVAVEDSKLVALEVR